MWEDEILEEIHRIREEHAKAFNYDIKAICEDFPLELKIVFACSIRPCVVLYQTSIILSSNE